MLDYAFLVRQQQAVIGRHQDLHAVSRNGITENVTLVRQGTSVEEAGWF